MTNNLQNTTQKTKVRVYFFKYLSSNPMFYQMKFYKTLVIAKISLLFFELLSELALAAWLNFVFSFCLYIVYVANVSMMYFYV